MQADLYVTHQALSKHRGCSPYEARHTHEKSWIEIKQRHALSERTTRTGRTARIGDHEKGQGKTTSNSNAPQIYAANATQFNCFIARVKVLFNSTNSTSKRTLPASHKSSLKPKFSPNLGSYSKAKVGNAIERAWKFTIGNDVRA